MEFKTENDFIINKDTPREAYRSRSQEVRKAIHWGQRKLFLTEMQFLTRFWDHETHPKLYIVYAGAAPGKHIPLIADMFPGTIWHLYDPRPIHIKEVKDQIYIHQQLFLDKDAKYWGNRVKNGDSVMFISDIRTADYKTMEITDNEKAVIQDMMWQMDWYKMINPLSAHMKFRLPYTGKNGVPTTIEYLDGFIFRQPWAPISSSETRIVPFGKDKIKTWNSYEYEDKLFHHNATVRETHQFINPFTSDFNPIDQNEGLLNDYDSLCEVSILTDYIRKFSEESYVTLNNIRRLSKKITENINKYKPINKRYTLADLRRDNMLPRKMYEN